MKSAAYLRIAAVAAVAAGIAGCGTAPVTIASDDAALCRYAAEAGAESAASCRGRLDSQHRHRTAANASRIEGYALLNTPAAPTAIADQCKQASPPKECQDGDVTGTIKRDSAQ